MQNGRNRLASLLRFPALALSLCGVLAHSPQAHAAAVGDELKNGEVRDGSNKPASLPSFGERVLLILYTDPDVANQNDAFADLVKAAGLPKSHFQSMGIANMKDAPGLANWLIRLIIRKKIKKYNVTILTDPDLLLAKAWNLGVCDDKSVVMLIDHKGVLQYIYKGALPDTEKKKAIDLMKELIAKLKAEHPSPEGAQPAGAASPAPAAGTSPPAAPAN